MSLSDLTKGNNKRNLLIFSLPMIAGNLLQQFLQHCGYIGCRKVSCSRDARTGGGGSAYTLADFLTSILLECQWEH